MWRNYLTVGFAALRRDPMFTGINLAGLAVGLAGCLLIVLFIRWEMSFDDWLPDAGRTHQVQRISTSGDGPGQTFAQTAFVAATALPGQFPEIEAATGLLSGNGTFRRNGEPFEIEDVYATDANFFRVLNLPLVAGDPATALADAGGIVLTEAAAERLFGRTDVLGETVTRVTASGDKAARVTGVLRDLPANSHLRIAALYRANVVSGASGEIFHQWNWVSAWVYARLRPGADPAAIEGRMLPALRRIVPASQGDRTAADGVGFSHRLVNVRDVNTAQIDIGVMRPGTSAKTLATFGIVAAFLLLVACVNFTNLATARASRRAREVALRKTLGATRAQLVAQFLLEAAIIVSAAGLLAIALIELALPWLNGQIGGGIKLHYLGTDGVLPPLVALLVAVAVAGGLYPAFFLTRFSPALVLKANRSAAEAPGAGRLRAGLVVIQFAVSIALIICTAIIYAQARHARSTDPGYKVPGLLFVQNPDVVGGRSQVETFMRRVAAVEGVTSVARIGVTPNPESVSVSDFRLQGGTGSADLHVVPVDGNTFETLGMRLVAGRGVTERREADVGAPMFNADPERDRLVEQRGLNVVVSEQAARELGFGEPQAALGRQILRDPNSGRTAAPYTIVGVVNDARFESARLENLPKLYFIAPEGHAALAVRFEGASGTRVMPAIEELWKSSVSTAPLAAFFADARIAAMYEGDEARARMFAAFAAFAVLISCLGLFGLAALAAQHRTKEIGIRKVLGARTRDIVRLLVWQLTRPVLLANLIAWPVAWWAMRDWLSEFQTRIEIGVAPFAIAGLAALAVAAATVGGHAVRVARANPIHALRYE